MLEFLQHLVEDECEGMEGDSDIVMKDVFRMVCRYFGWWSGSGGGGSDGSSGSGSDSYLFLKNGVCQ